MNDAGHGAHVNCAVQRLPTPPSQAANPSRSGGNRERNQKQEAREAHRDVLALGHVLPHSGKTEGLVRPNVRGEVQANVEEREQAKHAAKTNQLRQIQELAEGRDAEREDQEAERPIAGSVLDEFDRVRAELARERTPDQSGKRHEAHSEDHNFGSFAGQELSHKKIPTPFKNDPQGGVSSDMTPRGAGSIQV